LLEKSGAQNHDRNKRLGETNVNKKLIIIALAGGLVSFGAMFILAWLNKPPAESPSSEPVQTTLAEEETNLSSEVVQTTPAAGGTILESPQPQVTTASAASTIEGKMEKTMTEKQLDALVYEVREKIQEYDSKLKDLKLREQRLRVAGDTLKKDIEQLNNLRTELALTVASLKTERDKLLKGRVEIAKKEKNNLVSIAATYDKMESASAGKILTNMSQAQNNSADDAVKILHYMSDRTKAKVLASIAEREPAVSAYFCQKLKQIIERE
jgi:flagellar motility protein MotE (MotC chaperone)